MKSNLYIKVEVIAGTSITEAVHNALCLAKHLGVPVEFNFNGKHMFVRLEDNLTELVEKYHDWVKRAN